MGFSFGIVGLPNVGKSTLFNALSSAHADCSNYPFCTINPNIGVVEVPDQRLDNIQKIIGSGKKLPTVIEFHDIAGLVKGAHDGEGLGNQFLSNIRNVDAVIHLVRCFENENIAHVSGRIDPKSDIEIVNAELILSDLEIVEKRISKLKEKAKAGDKKILKELEVFEEVKRKLQEGKRSSFPSSCSISFSAPPPELLISKPVLYVANVDESGNEEKVSEIEKLAKEQNAQVITLCAKIEEELKGLSPEDAAEYRQGLRTKDKGLEVFIKTSYQLLDLLTFFTANNKEARAWTLKKGSTAYEAAGKIHSDMQKGFIAAEVARYKDLAALNDYHKLKETGNLHMEGRDYVVADGDLILFRFNI